MDERLSLRAWLWTLGACGVFYAASFVPVPGIDHEALRALGNAGGGLLGLFDVATPMISVAGQGLGLLVVVRGLLRLLVPDDDTPRPWAHGVGFAVYVLLGFAFGLVTAIWVESAGLPWAGDVVQYPGWANRLLIAVTLAAGSALVWVLATVISRRGVGQGPLVLFGAAALVHGAQSLAMTGPELERFDAPLFVLLGRLASVAAPAIVLVSAWRFRPERWPIRIVRGVHVTSPIDLLCLPSLAASIVLAPAGTILASLSSPGAVSPWEELAHGLVLAGASIATAIALGRRSVGRGSAAWVVAAGVGLTLALLLVAGSVVASGALGRILAPGPFEGGRTAHLELRAEGGDGAKDAQILVRRFAEVGLQASVSQARRGLVRIDVHEVGDLQGALHAVLPPRRVTFRFVRPEHEDRFLDGPPPAAEAAPLLDPGPPLIGPDDIADARVELDPMDGRPNVALQFTEEAGERFGDATGANVGRLLAIIVDDEVLSAPKVMSAIPGGHAQITLGTSTSPEQLLRDAQDLAAALRTGPLGARWTLSSER